MTRIDIEKKPNRSYLPLIIAFVVIALAAVGVYLYLENRRATEPTTQPAAPVQTDTPAIPPGALPRPEISDVRT